KFLDNDTTLQNQFPGICLKENGIEMIYNGYQFLMSWRGNLHGHNLNDSEGSNKKIWIRNPMGKIILKRFTAEHLIVKGNLWIRNNVSIHTLNVIGSAKVENVSTGSIQVSENIDINGSIEAKQINALTIKNHGTINTTEMTARQIENHGTICSTGKLIINATV